MPRPSKKYMNTEHRAVRGVYFLFQGDELTYVGKSVNVHGRIRAHRTNGRTFDRFCIMPVTDGWELDWLEAAIIRALQPRQNTLGVGRKTPSSPPKSWDILEDVEFMSPPPPVAPPAPAPPPAVERSPELSSPLTISVPEAGAKLFGLSRCGSYIAAKRGDIPTVKVGRLLRVPVAALDRVLEGASA